MKKVRATCDLCNEPVELPSDDITLRVCASRADLSRYSFNCPVCRSWVDKPADDRIISLLLSGGVRAEVWDIPAEVHEPKLGPPLNYDDLLDLGFALAQTDTPQRELVHP